MKGRGGKGKARTSLGSIPRVRCAEGGGSGGMLRLSCVQVGEAHERWNVGA